MDASIWGSCDAVERHPDRLSGNWAFVGTRVPISALFDNINDGATLDEFLEWYEGVERSQAEIVIDCQMKRLQTVTCT